MSNKGSRDSDASNDEKSLNVANEESECTPKAAGDVLVDDVPIGCVAINTATEPVSKDISKRQGKKEEG